MEQFYVSEEVYKKDLTEHLNIMYNKGYKLISMFPSRTAFMYQDNCGRLENPSSMVVLVYTVNMCTR